MTAAVKRHHYFRACDSPPIGSSANGTSKCPGPDLWLEALATPLLFRHVPGPKRFGVSLSRCAWIRAAAEVVNLHGRV